METNASQSRIDSLTNEYEQYYASTDRNNPVGIESIQQFMQMTQQENQKLIKNGGFVKRHDDTEPPCWTFIPTVVYVLFVLFTILMIFFTILQINGRTYIFNTWVKELNINIYIGLLLLYASYALFLIGFILIPALENRDFHVRPANSKSPVMLGIGNGIGFTFFGDYREVGDTAVSYYCFCIIGPLIPLGCYRVRRGETKRRFGQSGYSTSYQIYGSEKWNFLEIINLISFSFASISLIIGLGYISAYFLG